MPFPQDGSKYRFAQIKSTCARVNPLKNGLHKKPSFLIIALFILFGTGGVIAATSISVNSGSAISLGAGYATATACDENVTLNAQTALDANSGQLYVATIALSDISQNPTTGCGNKTMEMALKINGQMTYASWDIPASDTDSTFNFAAATISLSDYNAMTALTPFQVDGLSNVAIAKIGSFQPAFNWRFDNSGIDFNYMASSSDGTKLAATDYEGYIYTSPDSGVTWNIQYGSGSRNWIEIASSSDGTKLAAVNAGGYIYTSSDSGVTWVERTNSGARNWILITSSSDGTKLAAAVNGGTIYTSTNSGLSWTARTTITTGARAWTGITSSADGTKLAATLDNGRIYTSVNSGATWNAKASTGYWACITSSADGTKLAAADLFGAIYTSVNSGDTWTMQNSFGSNSWGAITSSSDGNKLAIIGTSDDDYYSYIYFSTDAGVTWINTQPYSGVDITWRDITSSADGTKIAAFYDFSFTSALTTKTRSSN